MQFSPIAKHSHHYVIQTSYNCSGLRSLPHFGSCKKYSSQKTYKMQIFIGNAKNSRLSLQGHGGTYSLFSRFDGENLPKSMLAEFSKLVGTLKSTIPATDRGILFSDPTRLQILRSEQSCPSLRLHGSLAPYLKFLQYL